MTPRQAEQLGVYKRVLAELRAVATKLHDRIVSLEDAADTLVIGETPEQAERLGAYKRELVELRTVAIEIHNRVLVLEANADTLLVGDCAHANAKNITTMGAKVRTRYCKDCGEKWDEPFEKAKGA